MPHDALASLGLTVRSAVLLLGGAATGAALAVVRGIGEADAWSGGLVIAAAVVAASGVAKIRDPAPARAGLAQIDVAVGSSVVRAIGAFELVIGIVAGFAGGTPAAALVAVAYIAFTVVAVQMSRAEGSAGCGCFGGGGAKPGALHVVVNLGGALAATGAAVVGSGGAASLVADTPWMGVPALAGATLGAVAVIAVLTTASEVLSLASPVRAPAAATFHLVDEPR